MVLGVKAWYEAGGGNYFMRSDHIGYAYIKDAKTIFEEARESLNKGHYHRTVRKCQEALGMARYVFDFINELLKKHDLLKPGDYL